jgi:hypothetical protein
MPSTPRRNWTRDETLVAFRLYCRTPFGRLHKSNPDIIDLARRLGRTPSAVGMKACNFASLDPRQRERGIKALANVSDLDERVWSEFEANPEKIAAEAEAAYEALTGATLPPIPPGEVDDYPLPTGPTDLERLVRVRRVQGFFRATVLASYDFRCALTGLAVPELLNASHIVPWSASVERRADPRNGVCLNALLDRAFDRGLIAFDETLTVVESPLLTRDPAALATMAPGGLAGRKLNLPARFTPDPEALAYHRDHIFRW